MNVSRREFSRSMAMAVSALSLFRSRAFAESAVRAAEAKPDSLVNGVQLGLQPFCYHDLPNTPENRGELIRRMVKNNINVVELHAPWVEPRFTGPGIDPEEARKKAREWRLQAPKEFYQKVKREFDDAGITIFTYWVGFNSTYTDGEVDATFEGAKALGCKGIVGSYGLAQSQRLAPFPGRHGMFLGLHNHDNVSDPDAYSNEASFAKGLAISPDFKATLDVRHFVAGNGDCLAFLEKYHDRTSSVHLGDRRRDNGHSTPFGEGDAPIIEVLRMIKDNHWPVVALLEFEHGTLRSGTDEVQVVMEYCRKALA